MEEEKEGGSCGNGSVSKALATQEESLDPSSYVSVGLAWRPAV